DELESWRVGELASWRVGESSTRFTNSIIHQFAPTRFVSSLAGRSSRYVPLPVSRSRKNSTAWYSRAKYVVKIRRVAMRHASARYGVRASISLKPTGIVTTTRGV